MEVILTPGIAPSIAASDNRRITSVNQSTLVCRSASLERRFLISSAIIYVTGVSEQESKQLSEGMIKPSATKNMSWKLRNLNNLSLTFGLGEGVDNSENFHGVVRSSFFDFYMIISTEMGTDTGNCTWWGAVRLWNGCHCCLIFGTDAGRSAGKDKIFRIYFCTSPHWYNHRYLNSPNVSSATVCCLRRGWIENP